MLIYFVALSLVHSEITHKKMKDGMIVRRYDNLQWNNFIIIHLKHFDFWLMIGESVI